MKTKWILQTNIFKEKAVDKMINCFQRQDLPFDLVKIIPFTDTLPEGITDYDGPVLAYGTTTLLRNISASNEFIPGMWFNEDTFKPSVWGPKFGDDWLNKESKVTRVDKVLSLWEDYKTPLFIRPDSDFKLFAGDIFYKYDYERWIEHVEEDEFQNLKLDTIVTLSPVKHILAEWRFIIIDKKVIAQSMYRKRGQLYISDEYDWRSIEAADLAMKIADMEWQPESAYTLDICETHQGYKVIEVNCFNASGYYACSVMDIIHHASELAEKEWKEK
ncbi:MAG: hypothetical protein DRI84_02880 [Bacteroidetes bacterium]|nr:MAG: hypothetical protein DRI84_02880 [Bacteroidota bacterium]